MFPVASAGLFSAAIFFYYLGWYRMRINASPIPARRRFMCFACGILLASAAWVTPLAHLDHRSLTGHMIQHLFLMTVAAPLVVLGEPALVFGKNTPQRVADLFRRVLIHRSPNHGPRRLTWLMSCWMAGTAVVIWWHIPSVFVFSMQSYVGHELEKTTFLAAGLLFWWPVLQQWATGRGNPSWSIVLYLFLATLPCDVLSAFLTFCGRVVYVVYASGSESLERSALLDQERAGSLMWIWVTFVYLTPAVFIAVLRLSGTRARNPCAEIQTTRSC